MTIGDRDNAHLSGLLNDPEPRPGRVEGNSARLTGAEREDDPEVPVAREERPLQDHHEAPERQGEYKPTDEESLTPMHDVPLLRAACVSDCEPLPRAPSSRNGSGPGRG